MSICSAPLRSGQIVDPQAFLKMQEVLFIQIALDEVNSPVRPTEAVPGHPYHCVECGGSLGVRNGNIRIKHFYHAVPTDCDGESRIHKEAKFLIKCVIDDWKRGAAGKPVVTVICGNCRRKVNLELADAVTHAEIERSYNGKVIDVALMENGTPRYAVEIWHLHKVEDSKYVALDIPVFELRAYQVIHDPRVWMAVNDAWVKYECGGCLERRKFQERASQTDLEGASTLSPRSSEYLPGIAGQEHPVWYDELMRAGFEEGAPAHCVNCGDPLPLLPMQAVCDKCFYRLRHRVGYYHCRLCGELGTYIRNHPLCLVCDNRLFQSRVRT